MICATIKNLWPRRKLRQSASTKASSPQPTIRSSTGPEKLVVAISFRNGCCAIEFMAVASSHYDIARFGSEVVRFSPKQSDVLMVVGTINDKMGPVLKQSYDQMAEPRCGPID